MNLRKQYDFLVQNRRGKSIPHRFIWIFKKDFQKISEPQAKCLKSFWNICGMDFRPDFIKSKPENLLKIYSKMKGANLLDFGFASEIKGKSKENLF